MKLVQSISATAFLLACSSVAFAVPQAKISALSSEAFAAPQAKIAALSSAAFAAPQAKIAALSSQHELQHSLTAIIDHRINQQLQTANVLMSTKIEQQLVQMIEL
ncbi:hypothetical protein [Psychrobium sp. 1_MG-2023]|uniref:hypothetical protein n=1 Tax=Psychrobium sp. 1_MG-2023 TaxID=3062624 RepID=UPI000C31C3E6|nr:hypothetical protein [Psychrobium sp. 1_MG-2023]MDP2561315.1 hypothetical protein [Psychrobium sp. 1_MG-2023]PKF54130.1 hypothetical protein CW748_16870 [Alteromonadales bacterium alter-6D02]